MNKRIQFGFSVASFLISLVGTAQEKRCGVLEKVVGEVQVLDASRMTVLPSLAKAGIPCGAWISVQEGFAQIKHQNSVQIRLNAQTFIQLPEGGASSGMQRDHLLLFKGQVYLYNRDFEEEFRASTAMARVRLQKGKLILIADEDHELTQLVGLENSSTLENRFEPDPQVKVQQGESAEMNFKLARVIPKVPLPVEAKFLRNKLYEFRIPEQEKTVILNAVLQRQKKRAVFGARSSLPTPKTGSLETYLRNPASDSDPYLRKHWVEKMVGDSQIGEKVLHPDQFYENPKQGFIDVIHPDRQQGKDLAKNKDKSVDKTHKEDEIERKRLLEELSKVRLE